MSATAQQSRIVAAMKVRELALFCLASGRHLFGDWTGEKLFKYLAFQWMTGQLLWLRGDDGEIAGVLIGWREFAAEILRRGPGDHFNWSPGVDGGDALMIGDVIVRKSESGKAGLTRLLQLASARWPDWKMRRVFTHRRHKLVELRPAVLARLFHEQPHHT
jgi:hypothetical protein